MTEKVRVRRALPEDRAAVLSFCERTWQWGDYIGDVWDRWVQQQNVDGPVMVALVGDQIAGVGKVTMISKAEAWLEGLRVSPAFRGYGVALSIWEAAEIEARKRWARVARFGTPSTNVPVHTMAERFGYHRVARFIEYSAPAEQGALPDRLRVEESGPAEVLVAACAGLASSGGLYDGGWHCQELRGGRLREHIVNGEAYGVHHNERLTALALLSGHDADKGLRVGFMAGNPPAVADLARRLRAVAEAEGLGQVMAVIPAMEKPEEAVRTAGYERSWEHEMWIYEKRLHG